MLSCRSFLPVALLAGLWLGCSGSVAIERGDAGGQSDAHAKPDTGDTPLFGCHTVTGAGADTQCIAYSVADCSGVSGSVAGPCPADGVYGCCIYVPNHGPEIATCYYSTATGTSAESACVSEGAYGGLPYEWSPTVP